MDNSLDERAAALLLASNLTLAVGESCTGGLLGSRLTDVPGSSAYFLGGVIAYSDKLKTQLLRVAPEVIAQYGAVSSQCALLMARGVAECVGADIGLSVTGIAGPTGGTAEKPVGTLFVALAAPGTEEVRQFCWSGGRVSNKQQSAEAALQLLVEYLSPGQ